jgi:hypothetical protein
MEPQLLGQRLVYAVLMQLRTVDVDLGACLLLY